MADGPVAWPAPRPARRLAAPQAGPWRLPGCGKCCDNPAVEATPLEFLPLAYQWFLSGEAESRYDELLTRPGVCINFVPFGTNGQGRCSAYAQRGLICRVFGYSARRDKYGDQQLGSCKPLKETQPEQILAINSALKSGEYSAPVAANYYRTLSMIDPGLGSETMPVNQAIRKAIEAVLAYYAYRPHPRRPRKAA